jgi:aminoglycoside phosphotransferase (APT) family kinase protein
VIHGRRAALGRPARRARRWTGLWEVNATREIQACIELGQQLATTMPDSPPSTVVHGDYRLGNVMFTDRPPAQLAGIDWYQAVAWSASLCEGVPRLLEVAAGYL